MDGNAGNVGGAATGAAGRAGAARPPEGDWLGTPYLRFERRGSLAVCAVDRPKARNNFV